MLETQTRRQITVAVAGAEVEECLGLGQGLCVVVPEVVAAEEAVAEVG